MQMDEALKRLLTGRREKPAIFESTHRRDVEDRAEHTDAGKSERGPCGAEGRFPPRVREVTPLPVQRLSKNPNVSLPF